LLGHQSGAGHDAVIQAGILRQAMQRATGAGLGVRRGEDQIIKPRQHNRAGTHAAWFERDGETIAGEPPVSDAFGGRGDREHFGVRSWVAIKRAAIEPGADDLAGEGVINHGADGYFAQRGRQRGKRQRVLHGGVIVLAEKC